ncbi:MAG: hypothetical protein PHQ59_01965 [Candidatus Daviesbacteria bacterium]|nr:hypothetical protein [Candidatus Daviesbacteria bacterium]
MKQVTLTITDHQAVSWNALYEQKHWSRRQELAQEIHSFVAAALPRERKIFTKPVDITIIAYYKNNLHRDSDNIASKLYIDGLKYKLIEEDDTRFVRRVTTEAVNGTKENKVIIKIKPIKEVKKYVR